VTFDADRVREWTQRLSELSQHLLGRRRQRRNAARKQNVGADFDFDPRAVATHDDELTVDEIGHRLRDFGRDDVELVVLLRRSARRFHHRVLQARRDADRLNRAPRLAVDHRLPLERNRHIRAGADLLLADLDRLHRTRRALECRDQRVGEHAVLALVDRGHRVHDDEEREQQRDQIPVRDRPRLVIGVLLMFVSACHGL
jgi:hypothetical protein